MCKLEYLTKENGKWYAEIIVVNSRVNTGSVYGWEGLPLRELRKKLKDNYNISIPYLSDFVLFKNTGVRKIYVLK